MIAKGQKELKIGIDIAKDLQSIFDVHERTVIPSSLILQSPVLDIVFEHLRQGIEEAKRLPWP
jgi:hypothetical protein